MTSKQFTPPTLDLDESLEARRCSFVGETFNDQDTKTRSTRLLFRPEYKSTDGKEIPCPAGVWCSDVWSDEEMILFEELVAKLDEAAQSAPEFKDKT